MRLCLGGGAGGRERPERMESKDGPGQPGIPGNSGRRVGWRWSEEKEMALNLPSRGA